MECGAAAQNASLVCVEMGLASCELGGLMDGSLSLELDLPDGINPLLGIAVGYAGEGVKDPFMGLSEKLSDEMTGPGKPIKDTGINVFSDSDSSFFAAWARFGDKNYQMGGATGKSYYEAISKAMIEAYERKCSGMVRIDYTGPANSLPSSQFLAPEELGYLSCQQRELMGLAPYNPGDSINWTLDMKGEYYIPSDFVFYGHSGQKILKGNSSGVAAHTNLDEAKMRALTELIERDAFLKCWHSHISPTRLKVDSCPLHFRRRAEHWRVSGFLVDALKLDAVLPVFLVTIFSPIYPALVSGAAASRGDDAEAVLKALEEAEYNLLIARRRNRPPEISVEEIKTPIDHGMFYQRPENAVKLAWLIQGPEEAFEARDEMPDLDELTERFDVRFVDLTDSEYGWLRVVRAVSPKLAPISFGWKSDYQHSSLDPIDLEKGYMPHFFA